VRLLLKLSLLAGRPHRRPASGDEGSLCEPLPAGALAVLAPGPAAGSALAFLQLFLSPPDAPLSGRLAFGILDPADELVARQRRDVLPGSECRGTGDECLAKVHGQFMHHSTGHSLAAHRVMVVSRPAPLDHLLVGVLPPHRVVARQLLRVSSGRTADCSHIVPPTCHRSPRRGLPRSGCSRAAPLGVSFGA